MIIMGVDPGAVSAAWGLIPPDMDGGVQAASCGELPVANRMVDGRAFWRIVGRYRPTHAVVEHVHAFPKQGVASSFRFGLGYGLILGVLSASGAIRIDVAPGLWKKHFRLNASKEESRALAIKRFPHLDLHRTRDAGMAEALLIGLWWRETGS